MLRQSPRRSSGMPLTRLFIGGLLLALIWVCMLIVLALHLYLGTVIKRGIEQVGPKLTRTSVTVKDVDVDVLTGRIQIHGLVVGNARGFQAPTALKVATVRVRVKLDTMLSDRVVIQEITVDRPEVSYEGLVAKSNIDTI